jgi:acetyltransferase-like isoleucine patch superfamily enzyme
MDAKEEKTKQFEAGDRRLRLWITFLHFLALGVLGFSLFPMVLFYTGVWRAMGAQALWLKALVFSFSVPFGYFLFGVTLIFIAVVTKNLFNFKIVPGLHTIHSKECFRWMGYNSLILIVNSAFLDVFRLSPFQTLFYQKMGAKIGKGLNVNTSGLADLALLEIGDNVLIGGGVALICHASERGFIRLAPTKIGNNVSIGLGSVIMPDCEIGDNAVITPCSLLPKGTRIPPRGLWGGNPVRDLRAERREKAET